MTKTKHTPMENLEARHAAARLFNEAGGEAYRQGLPEDSITHVVPKWIRDAWTAGWRTAERDARIAR